eukprot:gene21015-27877_t
MQRPTLNEFDTEWKFEGRLGKGAFAEGGKDFESDVDQIPQGTKFLKNTCELWGILQDLCELYTTSDALRWSVSVANAINHLHCSEPTVLHRDIKVDNILLDCNVSTSQLDAKLSDFDLHQVLDERKAPTLLVRRESQAGNSLQSLNQLLNWPSSTPRRDSEGGHSLQSLNQLLNRPSSTLLVKRDSQGVDLLQSLNQLLNRPTSTQRESQGGDSLQSMNQLFNRPSSTLPSFNRPSINQVSFNRAASTQSSLNQPSINGVSFKRPSINGLSLKQPSFNGPSINGASFNRAASMQSSLNQPSINGVSYKRPSINGLSLKHPSFNRPSSTQPSFNGPSIYGVSFNRAASAQSSLNQPSVNGVSFNWPSTSTFGGYTRLGTPEKEAEESGRSSRASYCSTGPNRMGCSSGESQRHHVRCPSAASEVYTCLSFDASEKEAVESARSSRASRSSTGANLMGRASRDRQWNPVTRHLSLLEIIPRSAAGAQAAGAQAGLGAQAVGAQAGLGAQAAGAQAGLRAQAAGAQAGLGAQAAGAQGRIATEQPSMTAKAENSRTLRQSRFSSSLSLLESNAIGNIVLHENSAFNLCMNKASTELSIHEDVSFLFSDKEGGADKAAPSLNSLLQGTHTHSNEGECHDGADDVHDQEHDLISSGAVVTRRDIGNALFEPDNMEQLSSLYELGVAFYDMAFNLTGMAGSIIYKAPKVYPLCT